MGSHEKGGKRVYFCLIKKFYNIYSELELYLVRGKVKASCLLGALGGFLEASQAHSHVHRMYTIPTLGFTWV